MGSLALLCQLFSVVEKKQPIDIINQLMLPNIKELMNEKLLLIKQ